MPFLLVSIVLWFGALFGLGVWFKVLVFPYQSEAHRSTSLSLVLFFGLFATGMISVLINYFTPVSIWISGVVLMLGWVLTARYRADLYCVINLNRFKLLGLFVLIVSLISVVSFYNVDTGYYHVASIAVNREFPVLPGVANLFGPFGHNSVWFLIESLFTFTSVGSADTFSLNPLLAILFLIFLAERVGIADPMNLVFILVSLLFLNQSFISIGGVTPDFPSYVLGAVVSWFALDTFAQGRGVGTMEKCYVILLMGLAVTVKISNLLILFPAFYIVGTDSSGQWSIKTLCLMTRDKIMRRMFGVVCVFVGLWVVRNILLSGCIVYPQPATCISAVPWAMPKAWVTEWLVDIKYHLCSVRETGTIFAQSACFTEWTKRLLREPIVKYGAILFLGALAYRIFSTKNQKLRFSKMNSRFIVFLGLGLLLPAITWLVLAPNIRFALWLFILFISFVTNVTLPEFQLNEKQRQILFLFCLMLGAANSIRTAVITRPGEIPWMSWPNLPKVGVINVFESGGLKVFKPESGFQCWSSQAPCTPQLKAVEVKKWMGRFVILPKLD